MVNNNGKTPTVIDWNIHGKKIVLDRAERENG